LSNARNFKLKHYHTTAVFVAIGAPGLFVALLRADSDSCAVFAAATIEFIGVFNNV
jgi:hypothetical protein